MNRDTDRDDDVVTEYDDKETNKLDIEYQKENNKYFILQKINLLYKSVVEPFKQGDDIVFNPNLFAYLTIDEFTNWVFENNTALKEIFNN